MGRYGQAVVIIENKGNEWEMKREHGTGDGQRTDVLSPMASSRSTNTIAYSEETLTYV